MVLKDMGVVRRFDVLAIDIVRKNLGESTSIYVGDMFNSTKWNDGFLSEEKYKGTYLDRYVYLLSFSLLNLARKFKIHSTVHFGSHNSESHYYHVFDERPRHLSPRQHIALVCQMNTRDTVACCYEDEKKMTIPSKGVSRIIGEWSASFDTLVCDKLDDVMKGIAENGEKGMLLL